MSKSKSLEMFYIELNNKEWEIIESLLPELPSGKCGKPWRDNREVLEGIL
ncbi:transposase [Candidatus Poribacteria bacterium]|nr:transposase [Candidatus Poribacteria bacterium]